MTFWSMAVRRATSRRTAATTVGISAQPLTWNDRSEEGSVAEDRLHARGERLGAVDHRQRIAIGVQAAGDQVGKQVGDDGGVSVSPSHSPTGTLVPSAVMTRATTQHLPTITSDGRATGLVPIAVQYTIVGCEDADPAAARIISVDIQGGIQLEVLDGSVEEHRHLLTTA